MGPRLLALLLVAVAALVPVALPWIKTPMILFLCHGLAVLGVTILIRAGQVSFGHAMYLCASGYTVAFLQRAYHLDALVLLLAGTLFSLLLGGLVGAFMVRYRGIFFGMLNLAFSMVLFAILGKFGAVTGGTDGLRFNRPTFLGMEMARENFEWTLLYVAIALAVACGLFVHRYLESVPGQALRALKTNETRLEYLGFSAKRVFWYGYVLSAALCGLGGSLFALAQGLITPEAGYWVRSAEIIFIAILGGAGHVVGAFLGAFVFEFLKLYAAALLTGAWQMTLGFVLIIIVFAAPTGLIGMVGRKNLRKPDTREVAP
jgi:ABC-type branched-subunit amino acid transport system permease subunit